MELMRATWTDERLDDLKDEVIRQGHRIDGLSERIDAQTDRLGKRIDAQTDRIDGLNQTILTVGGRIFAGCIAITVAIIGVIATQL
ncbi:MAG: hypothetical protein AB7V58_16710 [Solirubrobacterales bacterium]